MDALEKALLREIKASLFPISEAVEDFTFAIVEPRVPEDPSHRDVETLIHIYGMKRALERGSIGWGVKMGPSGEPLPCPYCGGRKYIELDETINSKITELRDSLAAMEADIETAAGRKKQNLIGKADLLRNDIEYLEDALDRFRESGKSEEKVLCPKCSGWEWADIERYKNPTTGEFDGKWASKQPTPWKMFMDWFWGVLKDVGLEPVKHLGFKDEGNIYGTDVPAAKGKEPIGPSRHLVIVVESMGTTNTEVHEDLAMLLRDADKEGLFFNITSFPSDEMVEKYEMAAGTEKLGKRDIERVENFEEWLDSNRGFYVSARVEESRFGEELGLPAYEVTTPLDLSKLLQRIKGEKVAPVTGEPPPREGEWGRYGRSIKGAAAKRRSMRSMKAHKAYKQTPEYYEKFIKPKEEEEAARQAAAEFPGSKYVHWDDHIDKLAEVMNIDNVSIELAVGKYMDSLDEFPKPFDFDRLNLGQAVRALNVLRAIEPDEIDSLVEEASKYLSMICESRANYQIDDIAGTVVSDLGSNRANIVYCELKELKKAISPIQKTPLYTENPDFNKNYIKAEELLDILFGSAAPMVKVIRIIPVDSAVFDGESPECWDNIFDENENLPMLLSESALVRANAAKLRVFFRKKMPAEAFSSLKNFYHRGKGDKAIVESITACWDSIASGRPLPLTERTTIKDVATRYKVVGLLRNAGIQL